MNMSPVAYDDDGENHDDDDDADVDVTDGESCLLHVVRSGGRVVAHAESPAIDRSAPPSFLLLLLISLANVATERNRPVRAEHVPDRLRSYFRVRLSVSPFFRVYQQSRVYQQASNNNSNSDSGSGNGSGYAMAHRGEYFKAIFLLWCVLGTAFSIPSSTSIPRQVDEQRYTTRKMGKVFVEMPTSRTRPPLPIVNSELKTTTTMPSTMPTTHRSFFTELPLYRLDGSNGQACILLQVDALITVKYRTLVGNDQEADIYVPDDATVTGNCDNENTVTMSLKWKAFVLSWSFAKTPGGERWYVEKIELTYNSSDKHFEHIDQPNKTIRLSTGQKHSSMLFPTPVGKSYSCTGETEIPLTDGKNHASVLLRDMKLQPFKFKNNEFAAEFSCTSLSARAGRDETAPVAVGSTLAAAVLLTITGYAAYRYFKVKKVKYDTME